MVLSTQNLHLGNANVNLRFKNGMVSPAYKTYDITGCSIELLAHWIKSDAAKHFFYNATTVGASMCRRNVEWETLYEQPLFLPSTDEQDKIASFLSFLTQRIDAQQKYVATLKKYKRGLLSNLFGEKITQGCTTRVIISRRLPKEEARNMIPLLASNILVWSWRTSNRKRGKSLPQFHQQRKAA